MKCIRLLALVFVPAWIWILSGCGRPDSGADPRIDENGRFTLRVQLDWRPEPEHGGLYQAQVDGLFEEAGLDVILIPGGTNALATQEVATGKADIGQSATTQVILSRSNGFPLVNIVGVFHEIPTGLLMHASNPISTFEELDGRRIMGRPEAVYIPYLKKRFGIEFEVIPQSFGLGAFLSDPEFIQEGFFIAEPYFLEREGAKVKWLALSEADYTPYAVLFTNDAFIESYPDRLKAFVRAYVEGWDRYLSDGDAYLRVHAYLKTINDMATEGFLEFSRNQILENELVRGGPERGEGIGTILPSRIAEEIQLLEELNLLEPDEVSVGEVLDLRFHSDS